MTYTFWWEIRIRRGKLPELLSFGGAARWGVERALEPEGPLIGLGRGEVPWYQDLIS